MAHVQGRGITGKQSGLSGRKFKARTARPFSKIRRQLAI